MVKNTKNKNKAEKRKGSPGDRTARGLKADKGEEASKDLGEASKDLGEECSRQSRGTAEIHRQKGAHRAVQQETTGLWTKQRGAKQRGPGGRAGGPVPQGFVGHCSNRGSFP